MNIVLLLSGVLDYKRPLVRPSSGNWLDILGAPTTPYRLSPFDEAALETALRLKSESPQSSILAVVTHGANDLNFVRSVAAFKPDSILSLYPPESVRANPAGFSQTLRQALRSSIDQADLLLIGREHGDLDDGTLPAMFARSWNLPFISNALNLVVQSGDVIEVERISSSGVEFVTATSPVMISVTNNQKNRLRHPLMKNIMEAKKLQFPVSDLSLGEHEQSHRTRITGASSAPERTQSDRPCRTFEGSDAEKARQLAQWLKENTANIL